ncbi:hypothetical protein [Mammaliicoccus vitulinus]|uniref:hypothetical protein n=1 Tax=Mammaliicoccus vitulinus TaxID=71237 RepID=UPI00248BA28A|nr:hypothetical protein [Mammaliicoccus vitulinus]
MKKKKGKNKQSEEALLKIVIFIVLLAVVLVLTIGAYGAVVLSDKLEVKANNEHEKSIKEIVKTADIKKEHITVKEKGDEGQFLPLFQYENKIGVVYDDDEQTNVKDLIIIGEENDEIKDKFIKDRKKPYKVKVMDTGAKEKILYQYDDYKLDTDSKEFKKRIRDSHDL